MSKWWPMLERDLKWRQAELAELKIKVISDAPKDKTKDPQTLAYKVMLRAAWGMLYAHYEGCCLYAMSLYLDEIEHMKIMRGECQKHILLFSLQHLFPKTRAYPDEAYLSFIQSDFVSQMLQAAVRFPRLEKPKDAYDLKGRSNLWPNLLAQACESCCIVCAAVDSTDVRLKILVQRRNDIAHGKDTPVKDHDEYIDYEAHVLNIMEKIAQAVNEALLNCMYLDPPVKHSHTSKIAKQLFEAKGGDHVKNWYDAEEQVSLGKRV